MVYISHPTEFGTTLHPKESWRISPLSAGSISFPLYVDGARLGYGLASPASDISLGDLSRLVDVFYIGGTKVGALCGEAVVFPAGAPAHFMTMVKQQGALLAKGRLLGIQFDALFTDGLYQKISENAIRTASRLQDAFLEKGYELYLKSPTNQIFVVLENERMKELAVRPSSASGKSGTRHTP